MTPQSFFWLLPFCWALAVVVTAFKFACDVLAADARGAGLPPGSLLSAARNGIRCGAIFTIILGWAVIFDTIDKTWALSLRPFSYDLTAYSGLVKKTVITVGCWMGFIMAIRLLDGLLERLLPDGPANPTSTA